MSKRSRIITILLTVILVISSITLPSSAAIKDDGETVSPLYTNVVGVNVDLTKVNGKVVITININGKAGTVFSSGEVALLKTSGSNTGLVKSWDRLYSNSSTFVFTDNSTTATTGTYKVNLFIKSLNSGYGETITGSDTLTV